MVLTYLLMSMPNACGMLSQSPPQWTMTQLSSDPHKHYYYNNNDHHGDGTKACHANAPPRRLANTMMLEIAVRVTLRCQMQNL